MRTLHSVLRRARSILDGPDVWLQGVHATDTNNKPVEAHDESATCFCLVSAIRRAAIELEDERNRGETRLYTESVCHLVAATAGYEGLLPGTFLVDWNDQQDREHGDVLRLLDESTARLPTVA